MERRGRGRRRITRIRSRASARWNELVPLISKTMPEDDPGTCVGEDADKVAAYIYDAFYSKVAQARAKPPAIELSRLTVRQYRNAVADLIGSFRPAARWEGPPRACRRVLQVAPASGKAIRSSIGSIPRSGSTSGSPARIPRSSIPARSRSAGRARSWRRRRAITSSSSAPSTPRGSGSTSTKQPLIDAWVKSGNDTEYRASIFLLGGRVYPLQAGVLQGQAGRG